MAFIEQKWEYSTVEEPEETKPVAGLQYLIIMDANFDNTTDRYKVRFKSLTEGHEAVFSITYFLTRKNSEPGSFDNAQQVGSVISLGKALAGKNIGLPRPDTIVGGVVLADVVFTEPNAEGKVYTNIYKYQPVPRDMEPFSSIEQYYTDEPIPQ